ncbi:ADP-ribosyl-[dinitrogen reductase] hydrolase [Kineococcus radiotolerans]|uniref:ADP-ribosyl-[dinitrogen reductase] hydrolase n=1 Tax=Kineococcus radiotolerans TaxID=131568 RepID=A0A7W4XZQ4_KINRA|nr:ADP-ribosylglycohydrolase family protein [Kineococcus radiotolerans]MBB2903514.1 ADP-ribosyl-[dinitrogen reductase] hydrolase [Kineococcus radiotolerans]
MDRQHRVMGAIVGSAVGDALGAPFEFGPPGAFSTRFPSPARGVDTEMCGGGTLGWAPGEFTDDTQMALLLGQSLVEHDGLDEADVFARFQRWAQADPPDIGIQTSAVLRSGHPWDTAAAEHVRAGHRAAGNGSLMRTTPAAVFFAPRGRAASTDAARRISALTHGDPAAGEGCAIFHEVLRVLLDGGDADDAVADALPLVAEPHRAKWAQVCDPAWTPADATEANGAVWPTLGSALWALRGSTTFEEALRLVVDLGGDTDTVACVTGALAGARAGITGIPIRWTSVVHGRVPGFPGRWELRDLQLLAVRLDGTRHARLHEPPPTRGLEPREVAPGVWASDLDGARRSDRDFAVVSLCRTGGRFGHDVQRFAYFTDDDSNSEIATVLDDVLDDVAALRAEGKPVLVHCHAGASRTGLVLRAWLVRSEGLSAREATQRVAAAWPHLSTWNGTFTAALQELARGTR